MKRLISITILLFNCNFLFAQYETFDISKYKLPDIKRQQLDFNFQSSGNRISTKYSIESDSTSNVMSGKNKNISNNFLGIGGLGYSFYQNSEKFQTTFSANTSLGFEKNKSSINNEITKELSDFDSYFSFNSDVNYFPGKKNWFLTVQPASSIAFSEEKDYFEDLDSKYTHLNGSLGLGGGKGRIEQVQDFRHAILLLQEIEKRRVSKRSLTEAEIYEFAQLISSLKNERFFDARKRKEKNLIAVDSFLVEKDVVNDEKNINYFVGLEDIWSYGDLQVRESGSQLGLVIRPYYNLTKHNEIEDSRVEEFMLQSGLNYTYRNPINLKWQFDFNAGAYYYYTDKIKEENVIIGSSKNQTFAYTAASIEFYPDTRTSFRLSGSMQINNYSDKDFFDNEKSSCYFQIRTSGYYYVSERLRLDGLVRCNVQSSGIFNRDLANHTNKYIAYQVALNYAIF